MTKQSITLRFLRSCYWIATKNLRFSRNDGTCFGGMRGATCFVTCDFDTLRADEAIYNNALTLWIATPFYERLAMTAFGGEWWRQKL